MKLVFTRIGLGAASISACAVFFWNDYFLFDLEKFVAFVTAVAVWIFFEISSERRDSEKTANALETLGNHDTNLIGKIYTIANDDYVRFLEGHDFGGSFFDDQFKPTYDLDELGNKASSQFNDENLAASFASLHSKARQLAIDIAYSAYPKNARNHLFSVIPEMEEDWNLSDETTALVKSLNEQSSALAADIRELYRIARSKGFVFI